MQGVFRLAVGLLFVLGILSFAISVSTRGPASLPSEKLTILIGSRGHMLPSATMDGGDESFSDAMAIGDLLLTPGASFPGLRVAVLHPDLEFRDYQSYDTASSPRAGANIRRMLNKMPRGTILLASTQGNVRPPGDRRDDLSDIAKSLGAEMSPFVAPAASWAIVTCKLDSGWHTLAESYSEQREVHLSLTLSPPVSDYADTASNVFFAESNGFQELDLFSSYDSSSSRTDNIRAYEWKSLGGEIQRSIAFWPTPSAPGKITWESITLGNKPTFSAGCGVEGAYRPGVTGAIARLRIQGEEVAQYAFRVGDQARWQPWSVDLSAWEGETISVEFEVTADAPNGSVGLLLGLPTLAWGSAP